MDISTLDRNHLSALEALLVICNREPKALVFNSLTHTAQRASEIERSIAKWYKTGLTTKRIRDFINGTQHLLQAEIAREEFESSQFGRISWGWYVTARGKWLQPPAAYVSMFLAEEYDISSLAVIGQINSPTEKKAALARIAILLEMADTKPRSVRRLSEVTGLETDKLHKRLEDLLHVENCDGEETPFIERVQGSERNIGGGYIWTGKTYDSVDFRFQNSKRVAVLQLFFQGSKFFSADEICRQGIYQSKHAEHEVRMAIASLIERGYVSFVPMTSFNAYRLTPIGYDYVRNCLLKAVGYLTENEHDSSFIRRNSPEQKDFSHAEKVYYKHVARIEARRITQNL